MGENETGKTETTQGAPAPPKSRTARWLILLLLIVLGIVAYTQLTIFVVAPIGAVPEGRTIVMRRLGKMRFIDSADAICAREMGGVSLLCRGAVLGRVASDGTVIMRLPYSETLYLLSTGGKTYER